MKKYRLKEGIDESGTPDMKYYAFDWDDNVMEMPTKIVLMDDKGEEVLMSTEDFADFRTEIGKQPFEYNGKTVTNFAPNAFRYFSVEGDKNFIVDCMMAEPGPAWGDFVECVNGGSIFSIITARGHSPYILKEACYNLLISNYDGLSSKECIKNLEKYREFVGEESTKGDIIREYLDMCKFYPVSYGQGSAAKPEELKNKALREFIQYIKDMSKEVGKAAYLKNMVTNNFIPKLGVSDDDLKNLQAYFKEFGKEIKGGDEELNLKLYSTRGGEKKKYKEEE